MSSVLIRALGQALLIKLLLTDTGHTTMMLTCGCQGPHAVLHMDIPDSGSQACCCRVAATGMLQSSRGVSRPCSCCELNSGGLADDASWPVTLFTGHAHLADVGVHLCSLGSHVRAVHPMHVANVVHPQVVGYEHVPAVGRLDGWQQVLQACTHSD